MGQHIMKNTVKKSEKQLNLHGDSFSPIVFNYNMRKTFVVGVLQDMKGYFEMVTDGMVSITYESLDLKNHEFSYKLVLTRNDRCTKQMFNEVSCALVNAVNYMFPADSDEYDVSISTASGKVEVEFASNW